MAQYSSKWIKVSEPYPHVLHIELARSPVNAFNDDYWKAYGKVFEDLTADGYDVRAAVVSSALPKIFTAGIDLHDASALVSDDTMDTARKIFAKRKGLEAFQKALGAPERAPFPVIAALRGHIIGLGVDLIGAFDIRYAAENALFSIKEVDIGFAPGLGSLAFLPKVSGNHSLIRELTYTARTFSASEALSIGLLSKVVKGGREEVVQEALALAKVIAGKSPVAVSSAKHLITHSRDHSVEENLRYTAAWNAGALLTNDLAENLDARNDKRAPKFSSLAVQTKRSKL